MSNKDQIELITDVELLKKDVSNLQNILGKLDTAIDKIADATGGISKMLAVHDSQIGINAEGITERRRLAEKENELIHRRISEKGDEVLERLDKMDVEVTSEIKTLTARVALLEKWKWWVMGGSWAIGFIIATLFQAGNFIRSFLI